MSSSPDSRPQPESRSAFKVFRRIDTKSPELSEPPDASFHTFEELRRLLLPWLKQ